MQDESEYAGAVSFCLKGLEKPPSGAIETIMSKFGTFLADNLDAPLRDFS